MKKEIRKCEICGITSNETPVFFRKKAGKTLCDRHNKQLRTYGYIFPRAKKDKNKYIVYDDHAEIELYDRLNNPIEYAIIDKEDVERCKEYTWRLHRDTTTTNYVIGSKPNTKPIFLHRFIMDYSGELQIDHINRDGLDNRKTNLRIVTTSINGLNKNINAVTKINDMYCSILNANKKRYILGYYQTREEAENVTRECKKKYLNNSSEFLNEYNLIKQIDYLDKGIHINKNNKYQALVKKDKFPFYIGVYDTIEEARAARDDFLNVLNNYPGKTEELYNKIKQEKEYNNKFSGIRKTKANTWSVKISIKDKTKYVGTYKTFEEALAARNKAQKIAEIIRSDNQYDNSINPFIELKKENFFGNISN